MTGNNSNNTGSKVLMILDSYFPSDIRVRKEFTAIIDAGYDVTLLCYRKKGEKRKETILGCNIIRSSASISSFHKGLIDMFNALFFINPVLNKELNRLGEKYDVIHVHDLPLANTALRFGEKHGMKTILDLHENYPEALKVWFAWRKGSLVNLKNKIFFNYRWWRRYERKMVPRFDSVLAVVDEMKSRIIADNEVDGSNVTVISNTGPKDIFDSTTTQKNEFESNHIIYVGGIGPHRGLDTCIRGMAVLQEKNFDYNLIIVGSGNRDNINYLKEVAKEKNVYNRVKFTGQIPFQQALKYMQTAFLNVIPHSRNGHTDNAVPHKLFQIMNSGYPLMVSSSAPLKRIVTQHDAGVVFEADNPTDFAQKVIWADENKSTLRKFVKNARDTVQNKGLNWETDAKKLVRLYDSLCEK